MEEVESAIYFSIYQKKTQLYAGATIYLGVYLDTVLSEVVLRAALTTDTKERTHESLAVSTQ